jgi:O-acetylhomoserine (thiol)-lyase
MNPTQDVLEKRVAALEGGIAGLVASAGGRHLRDHDHRRSRRQHRLHRRSMAAPTTCSPTYPAPASASRCASPTRQRRGHRRTDRRQDQGGLLRIIGNPLGQRHRLSPLLANGAHARACRSSSTTRSPRLTCAETHRTRRRHRGALADQIRRRPRQLAGAASSSTAGKFPWAEHKPSASPPERTRVSYHGVVYTEALWPGRLHRPRTRPCPCATWARPSAPMNAFLLLQGLETLSAAHGAHLWTTPCGWPSTCKHHPKVAWVKLRRSAGSSRLRPGGEVHGRQGLRPSSPSA